MMAKKNAAAGATSLALAALWCVAAHAQTPAATPAQSGSAAPPPTDQAQDQTTNQAPDTSQLRPFCTDRPTKSNGACTVDEGHFQVESDIFNASFMRQDGVSTDTYLYTNPTLKYGLTHTTDVEVNWAPYETVRTHDAHAGTTDTLSGIGDLYLRAKVNLIGEDSGAVGVTLFPYIKAPTARSGVGDGAWEGGLLVPIVIKLSNSVNLSFNPEVDLLENTAGDGRHANMAQLIDLSWTLPRNVTVFGEFWSDVNFDPTGSVTQYSADLAAAWGFSHDLQLDAGVNIGLNRATPAVQVYTGVSHRF
jgi:hypothetical protein